MLVTVAAQGLFVFNFLWTMLRRKDCADRNPWLATTLEWSGAFAAGEAGPVVYRGAYEFRDVESGLDFAPQNLERAPWEGDGAMSAREAHELPKANEPQKHQTT
jgi:hypothetical protein